MIPAVAFLALKEALTAVSFPRSCCIRQSFSNSTAHTSPAQFPQFSPPSLTTFQLIWYSTLPCALSAVRNLQQSWENISKNSEALLRHQKFLSVLFSFSVNCGVALWLLRSMSIVASWAVQKLTRKQQHPVRNTWLLMNFFAVAMFHRFSPGFH